jgi:uncharacterized membrane protein
MMSQLFSQRKCKPVHIKDLAMELKDHFQRSEPKGSDRLGSIEFVLAMILILCVWIIHETESYEKLQ